MEELLTKMGDSVVFLFLGMAAITLIALIIMIISIVQNAKLRKKYEKFMQGRNCENLEEVITGLCEDVRRNKENNQELAFEFDQIQNAVKGSLKKIGIVRYDAFKGTSGKMSFSLCLLDEYDSGFMLTNMKSTEGNYTYMKEIIHGKSILALGNEEKEALDEALACEKFE